MKGRIVRFVTTLIVAGLALGCTLQERKTAIPSAPPASAAISPTPIPPTPELPTATMTRTATTAPRTATPTATSTPQATATPVPPTATATPSPVSTSTSTPTSSPSPTATELPPTPTAPPASPSGVLFEDGFEGGRAGGSFAHWTSTEFLDGAGKATAEEDAQVFYAGSRSARFQITDGTQGGAAYVSQSIAWPAGNRLWYSCYFRVDEYTNVALGGIYLMEAFVKEGAWRERANIEMVDPNHVAGLAPGQMLDSSTFLLRMTYRGRDGGRDGHRQNVMIQAPARNAWHHVQMLVDLRGAAPRYAWWLNGEFIWQESDASVGPDTVAPTDFQAGITNVDWGTGNRARVWVDNCMVTEHGPEPPD